MRPFGLKGGSRTIVHSLAYSLGSLVGYVLIMTAPTYQITPTTTPIKSSKINPSRIGSHISEKVVNAMNVKGPPRLQCIYNLPKAKAVFDAWNGTITVVSVTSLSPVVSLFRDVVSVSWFVAAPGTVGVALSIVGV